MAARMPLELTPQEARGLVDALNDDFAETDPHKRDAIAAHQLGALGHYQKAEDGMLRLSDVKQAFEAAAKEHEIESPNR
jgi:hypothetical protein